MPIYIIAVYLLCFLAPFFVTVIFQLTLGAPAVALYVFPFLLFIYLAKHKSVRFDRVQFIFLLVYFSPPFLYSLIGVFFSLITLPHGLDYSFYHVLSIGRYINIISLLSFFVIVVDYYNRLIGYESKYQFFVKLVWFYLVSLLLIIVLGYWQVFSLIFSSIPFPFDTRDAVHSVQDTAKFAGITRLTSIANEPSYFAPLVMDTIILSFAVITYKRAKLIAFFCLILLIFSFSGGGYLNVVIIFSVITCALIFRAISVWKVRRGLIKYCVGLLVGLLAIVFSLASTGLGSIIVDRIPELIDVDSSTRAYMVFMPFVWAIDSGIVNFLFGHGVKSYALLGGVYTITSSGDAVHVTSNNLFVDVFWEYGLVGLASFIAFFVYIIIKSVTPKVMLREHWLSLFLVSHLIGSSIYRGDFASPRFFILVVSILFLISLATVRVNSKRGMYD